MHFKLIFAVGQSQVDGREEDDEAPVGLITANVVNNVKQFDQTAVQDWNINDQGPNGNGSSAVLDNSGNRWSYACLTANKVAVFLGESILDFRWTSGGSRLSAVGANDSNGSWNPDYVMIEVGTPHLTEGFEDKWAAWEAFVSNGGHTYEILFGLVAQGENDDPHPYDYDTDAPAWITKIREIVGVPDVKIFVTTSPVLSTSFNKKIREIWIDVVNNDENLYLLDGSSAEFKTADPVHWGVDFSIYLADRILDIYQKIIEPPSQPISASRTIFTANIASVTPYDNISDFLEVTGIQNGTIIGALNVLKTTLVNAGIWDDYVALWPLVGGTAELHKYNLKDVHSWNLGFTGCSHSSTGVQLNGTSGVVNTRIRITDFPFIKSIGFGAGYYSRTNKVGTDEVDMSFPANGSTNSILRVWSSRAASANKMRMDIGASGFALESTLAPANTVGTVMCQTVGTNAEIYQKGLKLGTKAFSTNFDVNGFFLFGKDEVAGNRWSHAEYQILFIRKNISEANCLIEHQAFTTFNTTLSRN